MSNNNGSHQNGHSNSVPPPPAYNYQNSISGTDLTHSANTNSQYPDLHNNRSSTDSFRSKSEIELGANIPIDNDEERPLLNSDDDNSPHIPSGFDLKFTAHGVPFLQEKDSDSDDEAANEHVREKLPLSISLLELEKRFGVGTSVYYMFKKFIIYANLFFCFLALINYIPHIIKTKETNRQGLFISSYQSSDRALWMSTSIIAIIFSFTLAPLYLYYVSKKQDVPKHDNPYYWVGVDDIKENQRVSSTNRLIRRIVSYTATVLIIMGCAVVVYFIERFRTSLHLGWWFNFLITGLVSCINFAWHIVCYRFTTFEKHRTWGHYRKHNTIKLFAFRILNVCAMYFTLSRVDDDTHNKECVLEDYGNKFLSLMITDALLTNTMEVIMPLIKMKIRKIRGKGTGSDEQDKEEFDISDEYIHQLYRQFLLYIGFTVFPMISFLSLWGNVVEYQTDKIRMLRICQQPKRVEASMKRFTVLFLIVTALFSLLAFPIGNAWILSGNQSDEGFDACMILPK